MKRERPLPYLYKTLKKEHSNRSIPSKKGIVKGIFLALALFSAAAALVLALTISNKTFKALKRAKWWFLIVTLISWTLYITFDGLRMVFLARAMGERLSFRRSVEVVMVGIFLAAITPFQLSGFPVQVYMLQREGLSVGTGTLVMAGRGLISAIPVLLLLVPSLRISSIPFSSFYRAFYIYVLGIGSVLLISLLLLFIDPTLFLGIIPLRFRHIRTFIKKEVSKLEMAGSALRKPNSVPSLLFSLIFSFCTWFFYLLMIPIMLKALNIPFSLYKAMSVALLLQFALLWSPSPGAVGVAEALGGFLLIKICPKELVGVLVILWRVFTFYLTAIIGGILFSTFSLSEIKRKGISP